MSNAGLGALGRAGLARGWCAGGLLAEGLAGDGQHGGPGPPLLDLTHNRVCPNSPHPSLSRGGGRGAQAHSRVLPMKDAGFARARTSPGSHQATAITTWASAGVAAPEAMAGSQGTRRVTTTCSWRSSAAARAAWACPVLSRLPSRVVRNVSRAA